MTMRQIGAVTIAGPDDAGAVHALHASLKSQLPAARLHVLPVGFDPIGLPGEIIGEADLDLCADDFARMAFGYDERELREALRPFAVAHVLGRGFNSVLLLSPTSYIVGDLRPSIEFAETRVVTLAPVRSSAVPGDGLRPTATELHRSGLYGPSWMAFTERARPIVRWWCDRVSMAESEHLADVGVLGDQRLLDWAALEFGDLIGIDHDPGLAVGYWNVDERNLRRTERDYRCGDAPLRLLDMRGFDPARPWSLGSDVADQPRVILSEQPALRELVAEYSVQRADTPSDVRYEFGYFPGGVAIATIYRHLYRQHYVRAAREGRPGGPVPDIAGSFANLQPFFDQRASDRPALTEYASILWRSRGDLMAAFPQPEHDSFEAFQEWLAGAGVREKVVPPGWALSDTGRVRKESSLVETFGVNVFGYFTSEFGLGESGRLLLDAVEASQVPMTTHVSGRNASHKSVGFRALTGRNRYPINLVAINADHFVHWHEQWGERFAGDAYTIGLWAWELHTFPPHMLSALQYVDEIWAISKFVAESLRPVVDIPVHVFPHPVKPVTSHPRPSFVPERPYFVFAFDYFSEAERKNPAGLIEAFTRAFPDRDGPALVVKSMNGDERRTDREKVRAAAAGREDIVLLDQYMSREDMQGLIEHALAFVSLHRSEGFGLGLFEAMSKGVPTIATGYSGNLEFMTEDNAVLLPYKLIPTGPHAGPYSGLGEWADPQIDAAAEALRRLAGDPQLARQLGAAARTDVRERFSLEHSAQFVRSRLRDVFRERLARRVPSTLRQPVPHTPQPEQSDCSGECQHARATEEEKTSG